MKKTITLTVIVAFFVLAAVPAAQAGSPQRHRWEGVAIGVGAAIVGSAILNNAHRGHTSTRVIHHHSSRPTCRPYHHRPHYRPCPPPRYTPPPPPPRGHWEVTKVWVEPVYERVWNPAHYNRHGRWVPGHWMNVEKTPGYWKEERVWVSTR
jgi:hypothetical protein